MIQKITLSPPKEIADKITNHIEELVEIEGAKLIKITKKEESLVKKDIKRKLDISNKQTHALRSRLVELNDLLEGVVEETNFPFEGASNITLSYAGGMAKTFRATFNRTAYQDVNIFAANVNEEDAIPKLELDKVEESTNYSFHTDSNGLETLKLGTVPVFRDGTLIVSGYWNRDIQRCNDSKIYKDSAKFMEDFPSPDVAGVTPEEYRDLLDGFILEENHKLKVDWDYDNIMNDGPAYEIIPLAEFIWYPIAAKSIREMTMYGKSYVKTSQDIKESSKRGEYYKPAVEELLKKKTRSQDAKWTATRNFIDGLQSADDNKNPEYTLKDLVYKADLDNDGILEKYLITYCPEHDILLSFQKYHIRNNVDFCIEFRLVERDGRFLGGSLLSEGQDKFELMDAIHRHRNNVRMLTTSPIMLINDAYKEDIDFGSAASAIKPGVSFYVKDIQSAMKQVVLQDLDRTKTSADEENLLIRYLELSIGPTQALSGGETPSDPRAPMGKTIALLQQANQRVDDYLDTFRKSYPALARLHCALLAQYGPDKIHYRVEQNGKVDYRESNKDFLLHDKLVWRDKRRSVTLSPEFAMQRLGGLMQIHQQLLPLIQVGNKIAVEMWNRMVIASGEPSKESLMITAKQNEAAAMMAMKAQIMQQINQGQADIAANGPVAQGGGEGQPPKKKPATKK